jgi:hypothetical protein
VGTRSLLCAEFHNRLFPCRIGEVQPYQYLLA